MGIFSRFTDLSLICAAAKRKIFQSDLKFVLGMVMLSDA